MLEYLENVFKELLKGCEEKGVVKVLKCKRRVVGFTAVAKKRSFRVLLLFGGDRVEKLYCCWKSCWRALFEVKWTIRNYQDLP